MTACTRMTLKSQTQSQSDQADQNNGLGFHAIDLTCLYYYRSKMKTHMNNTEAMKLMNDVMMHQQFANHQKAIHSDVKPRVETRRPNEVKVVRNNKVALNTDPKQHVNRLYSSLYHKKQKGLMTGNCDKHQEEYERQKQMLSNKPKKVKKEVHQQSEHERELRSLQDRVKNCKNLQQRKKDKTDPVVNPTYFMKPATQTNGITIDNYCQQVLGMNRPQSAKPATLAKKSYQAQSQSIKVDAPLEDSFAPVPAFSKGRPQTGVPSKTRAVAPRSDELPGCTFREILNHIVNNKLFKDVDLKVLYVRLCHHYGDENVDDIWEDLMDDLER